MPVEALVLTLGLEGVALFAALYVAGSIDAYILGSLLAPDAVARDLGSQNLVVKSSSEPHKIVYGRTMVGGCVVFLDVLDRYYLEQATRRSTRILERKNKGSYLNIAIAIAAHEIDGIEEVYFGDELVLRTNVLTGLIEPVSNKYKDYMEFIGYTGNQSTADNFIKANVDKHYDGGSASNATNVAYYAPLGVTAATSNTITFNPSLAYPTNTPLKYQTRTRIDDDDWVTTNGTYNGTYNFLKTTKGGPAEPVNGRPWGASHKLTNTAYLYFRLRYHPDLYSGIPQVRTVIRGKKLYDPRWDLNNIVENDTGEWAPDPQTYVVNDVVNSPSGKKFICIEAHTAFASAWAVDSNSDGISDAFMNDFIKANYWRQVQTNTDPDSWEYSDNWALCVRDYLTSGNFHSRSDNKNTLYGIGVKESEINDSNIMESANTADELVYLRPNTIPVEVDSYDTSLEQETITVDGDQTDYYVKHELLEITNASGVYYDYLNGIINNRYAASGINFVEAITEQLSRSATYIEESKYNTGTLKTTIKYRAVEDKTPTDIRLYSRRFTVNGIVDTSRSPISILEDLLASGAGKLPFSQGKFLVIPGVYIVPTITIGEDNLAGTINIQGSLGSANLINGVTGTIRNPANKWEESDFTKQTHPDYVTEDWGYELVQNVVYNFLTSSFDAQRLARISLQRAREGVSASLICNLSVSEIPVGAFINVNIARIGWVNKVFSVTSWTLQDGKINLGLREENSAAYDWVNTDLTPITYSPNTILQVLPDLDPITNLVLASGTNELIQTADGTIVPRVKITWTAPEQDFGTYLELDIAVGTGIDLIERQLIKIALVEEEIYYLEGIKEGDKISVSATIKLDDPNVAPPNNASDTVVYTSHTVVGKTQPPADVTNLVSNIKEDMIVLNWDNNSEIDFKHFEIRVGPTSWAASTFVDITKSTEYIAAGHSLGTFKYWVKGIDTSGIESTNAPNTSITIDAPGAVATINNVVLDTNINIFWGEVTSGTYGLSGYEIRYDGVDWANATQLAIIKSTDYTIPDTWVGSRTLRIKPIDIYNNLGPETTSNIIISVPSAPSLISSNILGDRIEILWDISSNTGTFPLISYNIRYDSGSGTFSAATPIVITSTDGFSRKVDWSGNRRFWIAPIDSVGNYGAELTTEQLIVAPGTTSITPQVIDNTVLLSWTDSPGTLPVDYYELRKGSVYSSASVIGSISGLFTVILETISDTFRYWITGVDTAGNSGTNNSINVAVSEPPDYILLSQAVDDFSTIDTNWLSRSFTNAALDSLGILILPLNLTETWTTHYTNNSWTTMQGQDSAGFPIYVQPTPASGQYQVVYDNGTLLNNLSITGVLSTSITSGDPVVKLTLETSTINQAPAGTVTTANVAGDILIDSGANFTSANVLIGSIITNITDGSTSTIASIDSTTQLTLSGTGLSGGTDNQWDLSDAYTINNWTSFPQVTAISIKIFSAQFRYIRTTVDVVSAPADTDIIEATQLSLIIDVKEKTDNGSATTNSSPDTTATTVNFNKTFVDISSIVITPNANGGTAVSTIMVLDFVDTPDPTSFDVYAFTDAGGNPGVTDFSWTARGY